MEAESSESSRSQSPETPLPVTPTEGPFEALASKDNTPTQASISAGFEVTLSARLWEHSKQVSPSPKRHITPAKLQDKSSPKHIARSHRRSNLGTVRTISLEPSDIPSLAHDFLILSDIPLESNDQDFMIFPDCKTGFLFMSQATEGEREVNVSAPSLSSRFSVGMKDTRVLPLLEKWLSTHGSALFSVYLRCRDWMMEGYLDDVFGVLCQHGDRFHEIVVQANDVVAEKFFTNIVPSKAVNVTCVKFDTKACTTTNVLFKIFTVIQSFPKTTKLVYPHDGFLRAPDFKQVGMCSRISWLNFTGTLDQDACTMILTQCANAAGIQFHNLVRGQVIVQEKPWRRTVLPQLKHLDIVISDFDITTILDYVTCPALRSLNFTTASSLAITPKGLTNFLKVSRAPLRVLNIFDYLMEMDVAIAIIRAVATHGSRQGKRRPIKNFGIFSSSLPKYREDFFKAWRASERAEGKIGLKALYFWEGRWDRSTNRSRVGWGDGPLLLE
ncbi:hypothetical protein BDZ97DRAFT_1915172 [Flammula alnicola]|nr:hypothetical protein BDZ97DRAFT_1915172 [Flammula alnicola]